MTSQLVLSAFGQIFWWTVPFLLVLGVVVDRAGIRNASGKFLAVAALSLLSMVTLVLAFSVAIDRALAETSTACVALPTSSFASARTVMDAFSTRPDTVADRNPSFSTLTE